MNKDHLAITLAAATQDAKTTEMGGAPKAELLLDGMCFHETTKHFDERGWLVEAFDQRWNWHDEPFRYGYVVSIKPGIVKGWALHKKDEDRYFVIEGVMELVTFDPRPDSATYGRVKTSAER